MFTQRFYLGDYTWSKIGHDIKIIPNDDYRYNVRREYRQNSDKLYLKTLEKSYMCGREFRNSSKLRNVPFKWFGC